MKERCQQGRIAQGRETLINQCSCGSIHLNVRNVTVRLEREAFDRLCRVVFAEIEQRGCSCDAMMLEVGLVTLKLTKGTFSDFANTLRLSQQVMAGVIE